MTNTLKTLYSLIFILLAALLVKNCATPVAPTGGEPDRTGPRVISTYPESGTTNFDDNEVSFTFDKFVDRNSFRLNVRVEPDLGIQFETSFSRKRATVEFQSPLPDNTTVVITVGTDVTDTNRNRMESSFDLALSTGDVLDDGTITARVLDADTGRGESGRRVFLYREPYDLTQRSIYVAETDTAGIVSFGYISEGTYKAFWVNDINRNRIWDRDRERAQPFYSETFDISHGDSVNIGTLYVSIPDTVSPRIEGVGLLSERRLRLRLSEEVVWRPDAFISVTDTLENEFTRAYPLFESETDPNIVFAQAETALPETETFTLRAEGITDAAGNRLRSDFSPFTGSSEPDTTYLRTVQHNAGTGLFPDEPLEITYTKFIDDDAVLDSLVVVEGDRIVEEWANAEIDRHILRIRPEEVWEAGIRYQFRVWNPWEEERELIEPDIWQRNQLGSIEITVQNNDPEIVNYLKITDHDFSIEVDTTFTDSIVVGNLPPLTYRIIVFQDNNENGRWDPGVVEPYEAPEPYAIRRSVPVREGFTSEVEMVFQNGRTGEPEEIELPEFPEAEIPELDSIDELDQPEEFNEEGEQDQDFENESDTNNDNDSS